MSLEMDSDAEDAVVEVDQASEGTIETNGDVDVASASGVAEVTSTSGVVDMGAEGAASQEVGATAAHGVVEIDPGRLEGQHYNQILTILPSDREAAEEAVHMRGMVRDYTTRHGYGPGPEVNSVEIDDHDTVPELGSYSDGTVRISNYTEVVNEATAAHELMHGASFNSEYTEADEATGGFVHHDICGIDEITTVHDRNGEVIAQQRCNEALNEGLTVSYTREMLDEAGRGMAAGTDESLAYDIAADVASEMRDAFPAQTANAYFNGQLEELKSAVDVAAERQGAFDEISTLLDRVNDESLSLAERADCYDRVYDLMGSMRK